MAIKVTKIAEIFKTIGQPTITYVERDDGFYEKQLSDAIDSNGQLCLITGASKTGKTTLYKRVLQNKRREPLIIRCDKDLTSVEFWKKGLEQINAERISKINNEYGSEISGKLSLSGLISLIGKAELGAAKRATEAQIIEKILANPSPDHLLELLKKLPVTLVVEDFHYLNDDVKEVVFQQWKNFIDNEVSVVVLGTTHRAVDIANSNKDLVGRIRQIDISQWKESDLSEIMNKGFDYIGVERQPTLTKIVAKESVGLPIITQQACLQIFLDKRISNKKDKPRNFSLNEDDVRASLHNVARHNYRQLDHHYKTITKGPRQKARKYNTYEMVMLCFAQDPLKFELSRSEIDERLGRLNEDKPPAGSIASTLGALERFQNKSKIALLEWISDEKMLYIIEPAFLFYVRWREKRLPEEENSLFRVISFYLDEGAKEEKIFIKHKNIAAGKQGRLFYFNTK